MFDELGMTQAWLDRLKGGYVHDAPVVNTDKGMVHLMTIVKNKVAELETRDIDRSLTDYSWVSELREQYDAAAIVKATGLRAREVANDHDVYLVRGANQAHP